MLLTVLQIVWAVLLLSSVVSMMAVFLGSVSPDVATLLSIQLALLPCTAIAIACYLQRMRRRLPAMNAARVFWKLTPNWLIFVVVLAASLALIAELALFLASAYADEARSWREHVPAICALLSSIALATGAAARDRQVAG